jgi:hypothetical protein
MYDLAGENELDLEALRARVPAVMQPGCPVTPCGKAGSVRGPSTPATGHLDFRWSNSVSRFGGLLNEGVTQDHGNWRGYLASEVGLGGYRHYGSNKSFGSSYSDGSHAIDSK